MRQHDADLLSALFREGKTANVPTGAIYGGIGSPLVESGILVRDGELDEWETQEEPYFTPILHDRWDRPYYSDGAIHALTDEDIQLWRVDETRFAEILSETFDCTDKIREAVPGVLWNLGRTSETIGRFAMREVYFAPRVESRDCPAISHLPRDAKSYILIAGWMKPGNGFDDKTLRHSFNFHEAVELSNDGEWRIRHDRIDRRFAPENRSGKRKADPKFEQKKDGLRNLFYGLCFALRKKEDYGRLCDERKRLGTGKAICAQTGFNKSFVSKMIGAGGEDPVAVFWHDVFMNQEKFDLFDEWVKPNVMQKQRLGPVLLKEEVDKYINLKAVEAARRIGRAK